MKKLSTVLLAVALIFALVLFTLNGIAAAQEAPEPDPAAETEPAPGPVNINTATAEEIAAALNGVGETYSARIVEYREAHGPFTSRTDLMAVEGIGPKTVEKNSPLILVEYSGNGYTIPESK